MAGPEYGGILVVAAAAAFAVALSLLMRVLLY